MELSVGKIYHFNLLNYGSSSRHYMFRIFGAVILLLLLYPTFAQEYNFRRYRVEDGLPSDIVKGAAQDSLGYFWIATDEGLVKYDGVSFTEYRQAVHSPFMKGFFTTRNNRLLAFGDLDLLEIRNDGQQPEFAGVYPVVRENAGDSSLSFPKLLYEDVRGDIWVSESQSVVRLRNGSSKRFEFDLSNRTPRFLRAFSFFEDLKQHLFVISFQGNVFRYDSASDRFIPFGDPLPPDVEYASVIDNHLMIGSTDGLYSAPLLSEGGFGEARMKVRVPEVSYVAVIQGQKVFIATRGNQHLVGDLDTDDYKPIAMSINNINHVYVSREKDIWISSNDGLIRMKENLFRAASLDVDDFIESIAEDVANNKMYYATQSTLYIYDKLTGTNSTVISIDDGYFQSLLVTDEGVWAANAFQVILIDGAQVKRRFDFSTNRRFVTQLRRDNAGNIWLTIPGSPVVYKINRQFGLEQFKVPLGKEGVVNGVYVGRDGIYVASNGVGSYLFFMSNGMDEFTNISLRIAFPVIGDFNVTDLAFVDDVIWMATSEGLLSYADGKIRKVMLGPKFSEQSVKLVEVYAPDKLLLSNAYGVMLFDPVTESHDLFNESSGLPSNAIGHGGLLVGHDHQVWIVTSKGLCYGKQMSSNRLKTPRPRFVETFINGRPAGINPGTRIRYRDFISVTVSSITFPENELTVQYRFRPDTSWITSQSQHVTLPPMEAGEQVFEVRTKKSGPYAWSSISSLTFIVSRPFWQQLWFMTLLVLAAFTLVTLSFALAQARSRKKTLALQRLVDERTIALRNTNEELIALNQEKNNLIGIVAHDLKSPLNQLQGLISLIKMSCHIDDQTEKYINLMNDSAVRLNEMVSKILDVNAIESRRLNLAMERLCLSDILHAIVDRYTPDASKKNIIINRAIKQNVFIHADRSYTEQVLENLLSNALKFSPHDREVFVSLNTENDEAICEVRDQGPGLSDEDKRRLFSKYQRLSARPTDNENSTGLGLSIARRFVSEMGGRIWCESEWGSGASFFISFKNVP